MSRLNLHRAVRDDASVVERAIVGRQDEITAVLRALTDPECDGVFLVATDPGAGATTVLDAVLARLAASGRPHNRIVASRGAAATPYGALAHVLPGPAGDQRGLYEQIRERVGPAGDARRRFVTAVDDVRWLDPASLGLLSTLIAGRLAMVLATLRAGEPVPPAVAAVERSCQIVRVPIGPLAAEHVGELVALLLPGPVDGMLVHEVATLSRGNPLFVSEVVSGARDAGALQVRGGLWTRVGALAPTARLASVFDPELDDLDTDERRLVEVLAVCGELDVRALQRLELADAAISLDRRGLAGSETDGVTVHVRLAQPLLGALVAARTSPLQQRAIRADVLHALAPVAAAGDRVRLVAWAVETGPAPSATDLLDAARDALAAGDLTTGERFADALGDGPAGLDPAERPAAQIVRADVYATVGRFADAARAVALATPEISGDADRAAAALVHQRVLLWSGVPAAEAARVLDDAVAAIRDPATRDLVIAARAGMEAIAGRPADCAAIAGRLTSGTDRATTSIAFPRAIAAIRLGRVTDGLELARTGSAGARPGDELAITLRIAEGTALGELGRFAEAEAALAAAYAQSVERRMAHAHVWACAARARVELVRMRPRDAHRWFVEARAVSERIGFGPGHRAALDGLLVCASLVGDHARVRELGEELDRLAVPAAPWPHGAVADAARRAALGAVDDAVVALLGAATAAADREERLLAADCIVEAVRLGAGDVPAALLDVLDTVDGSVADARSAFARGAISRDGALLERAERAFAALGIPAAAAEAAGLLARVASASSRRAADAAAVRAARYTAASQLAASPQLRSAPAAHALTAREAEVAELAARGTPSKEIAARLGVSVRTVSNHLQHAYTKLGVSTRDDLRGVLAAGSE